MNDNINKSNKDDKSGISAQNMRLRVYYPSKGSPAFSLSRDDLIKIGKGALIVIGGAALTALADWLQVFSDNVDFGVWEAISVAIFSTLINLIRKFVYDTRS